MRIPDPDGSAGAERVALTPHPPLPITGEGAISIDLRGEMTFRGRGTCEAWSRLDGWSAPPSPMIGRAGAGGVRAPLRASNPRVPT